MVRGNRKRGCRAGLVSFLVAVLAIGAVAPVGSTSQVPEIEQISLLRFSVEASDGYRMDFTGFSRGSDEQATISVTKDRGTASYSLRDPEVITERRIVADFGRFGRVAVTFDPAGGDECNRRGAAKGTFSGTIRFAGEDGFTRATATEAEGSRTFYGPSDCNGDGGSGPSAKRPVPVLLSSCSDDGSQYIVAKYRGEDRVNHQVTARLERTAGLQIHRYAVAEQAASSFTFKRDLSEARVDPGGRFEGSAEFSAKGGTLRGRLTATVPGRSDPLEVTPAAATMAKGIRDIQGCGDKAESGGGSKGSGYALVFR